jgi:hypothetical protein
MICKYYHAKWLKFVYVFLYAALAFFLPLNKVGLSITTLLLVLTTLLFTPLSIYKSTFKAFKSFQALIALLFIVLISLFWTNNLLEGLKFINLILPFFLIYIVFLINPVFGKNKMAIILNSFLASVILTTAINLINHYQRQDYFDYDMRDMSLFTSHIRLSLMVSISIVICLYYFLNQASKWKWSYLLLILYFVFYTLRAEVISGYISTLIIILLGSMYWLSSYFSKRKKAIILASFFLISLSIVSFVLSNFVLKVPETIVLTHTKKGNKYWSDTLTTIYENNYPVNVNIQIDELKEAWSKRSSVSLDSIAKNKNLFKWNLIRYMTSKGLNKDAEAVSKLSNQDIKNIENGYVSILQLKNSFVVRFQTLKDELLSNQANPNGYTFLQRVEYWKAGLYILKNNVILGVGSGGAQKAFDTYYETTNSPLTSENRKQAHQQFLSIAVNYGIIGLLIFTVFVFYIFKEANFSIYAYLILTILVASFFTENTLETQVGATLVAFFAGLLVSFRPNREQQ